MTPRPRDTLGTIPSESFDSESSYKDGRGSSGDVPSSTPSLGLSVVVPEDNQRTTSVTTSEDSGVVYSDVFDPPDTPDLTSIGKSLQDIDWSKIPSADPKFRPGHRGRHNWSLGQRGDFLSVNREGNICRQGSLGRRPPYYDCRRVGGDSRSSTLESDRRRAFEGGIPSVDAMNRKVAESRYDSLGKRSHYDSIGGRSLDELSTCSCGHPMLDNAGSQFRVDEDMRPRLYSTGRHSGEH